MLRRNSSLPIGCNRTSLPGSHVMIPALDAILRSAAMKALSLHVFACVMLCLPLPSAAQIRDPANSTMPLAIRGKVLEPGYLRPISEADVVLYRAVGKGEVVTASTYTAETALANTRTDASGSFSVSVDRAGTYRIEAKKSGYRQAGPMSRGITSAATVVIEDGQPVDDVRLLLAQPGEIQAVVVDEATDAPLAGQSVVAFQSFYLAGQRRSLPAGFGATNEKGEIAIGDLSPADYFVRVRVRPFGAERIVREFSEDDAKQIDRGYQQPNSQGTLASPVTIRSGDRAYLGTIPMRGVSFYRAHFVFPPGSCNGDTPVNVAIANMADGAYETTADIPCSKESFLVKGLTPGSYRAVTYLREEERSARRQGTLDFEIIDRNVTLELPLSRGADVSGHLILPEGPGKLNPENVHLQLEGIGIVLRSDDLEQIPVSAKGEFDVYNVATGEKRIKLIGLPRNCYVRELRYNGIIVAPSQFRLDPGQLAHKLEVTIANDTATIRGTVRDWNDVKSQSPYVVAVPAASARAQNLYPLAGADVSGKGEFQIDGLPPGDYLALAVASGAKPDLENPEILNALLRGAQKLTLAPNGLQLIDLRLTELR